MIDNIIVRFYKLTTVRKVVLFLIPLTLFLYTYTDDYKNLRSAVHYNGYINKISCKEFGKDSIVYVHTKERKHEFSKLKIPCNKIDISKYNFIGKNIDACYLRNLQLHVEIGSEIIVDFKKRKKIINLIIFMLVTLPLIALFFGLQSKEAFFGPVLLRMYDAVVMKKKKENRN